MGAIQNLKLQIGLITFDVAMQKASNERNSIAFKRLHKSKTVEKDDGKGNKTMVQEPCLGETGQNITCKSCATDITHADCTKGYEFAPGRYIEVTEDELAAVKVATNGAIITGSIVPQAELYKRPFMLTGSIYHLVPPSKEKYPSGTYALMLEALRGDNVAIGKTVRDGRTQTVAIVAGPNCFMMYTLRYQTEVRPEPVLSLPPLDQSQLALAKQIVAMLRQPEMDLSYRDEYEEGKKLLIDNKLQGVTPSAAPQQAAAPLNNSLDDMLKRSLEELKKPKEPEAKVVEIERPAKKSRKKRVA